MDVLERISDLKKSVDQQRRKVDRATGALEQLKGQLKKEFNCNSLEEAKKKLFVLKETKECLEHNLEQDIEQFKEKYGDRLNEG